MENKLYGHDGYAEDKVNMNGDKIMNELKVDMNGYLYYLTPEDNVYAALGKLSNVFSGANINVDNIQYTAVLRDGNGNDISDEVRWDD